MQKQNTLKKNVFPSNVLWNSWALQSAQTLCNLEEADENCPLLVQNATSKVWERYHFEKRRFDKLVPQLKGSCENKTPMSKRWTRKVSVMFGLFLKDKVNMQTPVTGWSYSKGDLLVILSGPRFWTWGFLPLNFKARENPVAGLLPLPLSGQKSPSQSVTAVTSDQTNF